MCAVCIRRLGSGSWDSHKAEAVKGVALVFLFLKLPVEEKILSIQSRKGRPPCPKSSQNLLSSHVSQVTVLWGVVK